MNRITHSRSRRVPRVIPGMVLPLLVGLAILPVETQARELMTPKEQAQTEFESIKSPSFDDQKGGVPQSIFV